MLQIIFSFFILLSWGQSAETKSASGDDSDINENIVRSFLPDGSYRNLSTDPQCLEGRVRWVDSEKLAFGWGARPVLFHSFDSQKVKASKFGNLVCSTKTTTAVLKEATRGVPTLKVTETIVQTCGATVRTMVNVISVIKRPRKYEVTLITKDSLSPKTLTCNYEK